MGTIKVSNSFDPDFLGLICVQIVCKNCQQTSNVITCRQRVHRFSSANQKPFKTLYQSYQSTHAIESYILGDNIVYSFWYLTISVLSAETKHMYYNTREIMPHISTYIIYISQKSGRKCAVQVASLFYILFASLMDRNGVYGNYAPNL